MDDGLLDTDGAAQRLKLSAGYLERLRVRGGGPAFVTLGRRAVRYRLADLDDWVASRLASSTSERAAA